MSSHQLIGMLRDALLDQHLTNCTSKSNGECSGGTDVELNISKVQQMHCLYVLPRGVMKPAVKNITGISLKNIRISHLPPAIGQLPLQEINIVGVPLGITNDWRWLGTDCLQKSVRNLNLTNCKLRYVPAQIVGLSELNYLYLNDNYLESVPFNMRRMTKLRSLHVRNNKLRSLPAFLVDSIGVGAQLNPFQSPVDYFSYIQSPEFIKETNIVRPLWLLAATRVYMLQDTLPDLMDLPAGLISFIKEAPICECGKLCQPPYGKVLKRAKVVATTRMYMFLPPAYDVMLCGPYCNNCELFRAITAVQ